MVSMPPSSLNRSGFTHTPRAGGVCLLSGSSEYSKQRFLMRPKISCEAQSRPQLVSGPASGVGFAGPQAKTRTSAGNRGKNRMRRGVDRKPLRVDLSEVVLALAVTKVRKRPDFTQAVRALITYVSR